MKLQVRHAFACTPDEFWTLFWDPSYDGRLQKLAQAKGADVAREVLSEREEGGKRYIRYRFTPKKTLPPAVAKITGTDRLIYEQDNMFDRASNILTWKVIPALVPDKITAQGTFRVVPTATGCERLVDGQIEVRITFIGGRIEQSIVNDVTAAYESATAVMNEMIAERRRAT